MLWLTTTDNKREMDYVKTPSSFKIPSSHRSFLIRLMQSRTDLDRILHSHKPTSHLIAGTAVVQTDGDDETTVFTLCFSSMIIQTGVETDLAYLKTIQNIINVFSVGQKFLWSLNFFLSFFLSTETCVVLELNSFGTGWSELWRFLSAKRNPLTPCCCEMFLAKTRSKFEISQVNIGTVHLLVISIFNLQKSST